jgi:hypothetical protein
MVHAPAALGHAVTHALAERPAPAPPATVEACLWLAVLLTMVGLALAALRRPVRLRAPRPGRWRGPPRHQTRPAPSLSALQVLRL